MTTIAFKDGVVAADTGMTAQGSRIGHMVKIVKRNGDVAGGCGCASWAHAFRAWFMADENGPAPEIRRRPDDNEDAKGIIFRHDGRIEIYQSTGPHDIVAPFYAVGSGAAEARGAMQFGASAEEAVRVAMVLDESTYGSVTVLCVG